MKCRINETTERHSEGENGHTQIRIMNGKMNMKENKRIITGIDNIENYIVCESVVSKRKEKICSDKKKPSGYTRSHSESRTNKRKKRKKQIVKMMIMVPSSPA